MYPASFCHHRALSSSSKNRGSYLQWGKQCRSNHSALWSARDFHYQLLSQFPCPSPPRHANNVKETITNSPAMVGLLVSPFAQNTNSRKLHPYQGKIRSKKGAYKGGGGTKQGLHIEGEKYRKKKHSKNKTTKRVLALPLAFIPASIPAKKKKPKTSVSIEAGTFIISGAARRLNHTVAQKPKKAVGKVIHRREAPPRCKHLRRLQKQVRPFFIPFCILSLVLQEHCAKVI